MNWAQFVLALLQLAPQEVEAILNVVGAVHGHQVLTQAAANTQKLAAKK
jgi:hypothetical protein